MTTVSQIPLNTSVRQFQENAQLIEDAVAKVLHSGFYLLGEQHECFEQEFASYCGTEHCVLVANGTDALELALRAVGCDVNSEVITTANAGGYATTACQLIGATPVYVDIREDDLTMDPMIVHEAVSARTAAIVVTHLYGKLADIEGIRANVPGIPIVEDCAQAHGAIIDNKKAGAFGDVATFSFYPTKNLGACGDAGAVICNDAVIAEKVRRLRQYGWTEKYHCDLSFGRNSRIDEIQAAILRVKLPSLDRWNIKRREIVKQYKSAVAKGVLKIVHEPNADYVAHLCIARHPERDRVREMLKKRGIATAIHYPKLDHTQKAVKTWRATDLSVSERVTKEIFTIPCFPEMTEGEIQKVVKAIQQWQ